MQALVKSSNSHHSVPLLSFLGVCSVARTSNVLDYSKIVGGGGDGNGNGNGNGNGANGRSVIHISQLRSVVKWGGELVNAEMKHPHTPLTNSYSGTDIILFRCANAVSGMQRLATGAEWDHIGIVVKRKHSKILELLESTGDGVGCYPLMNRLKAYGTEFTSYMAIRSLEVSER